MTAKKLFSFEWRKQGTQPWTPVPSSYDTPKQATFAAARKQHGLADEGLDAEVRVVELVDDGRGGRVARERIDLGSRGNG